MKRTIRMLGVLSVFVVLTAALTGCATRRTLPPDWYEVTGSGVINPNMPVAQGRLMAERAAKEDAYRQLLETAKGMRLESGTSVENFMAKDDYIRSQVNGIIRGAIQESSTVTPDGAVEVRMKMDLNNVRNLVR